MKLNLPTPSPHAAPVKSSSVKSSSVTICSMASILRRWTLSSQALARVATTILLIGFTVNVALGDVVVQAQPAISERQFDSWMFQTAQNEDGCRKRLKAQLGVLLDEAVRDHNLTEAQQRQLQLAGRGDVKRYFDEVEIRRDRFNELRHDRQKMNEIFQDIQPLQQRLNKGLFDQQSLFFKVLQQTLTDQQRDSYQREASLRSERRAAAAVRVAMVEFEHLIPLTHVQRERLSELLLKHSPPVEIASGYLKYLMHYRMSQIEESEIEGLFDETQHAAFLKYAQQGKGYVAFLRQQGLIDE